MNKKGSHLINLMKKKKKIKEQAYIFVYRSSFVLAVRKVNKNAGFTDCVAGMLNHIAVGHGIVQYLLGFCRQRLDFRSWLHFSMV